jgi:hypothetical protein
MMNAECRIPVRRVNLAFVILLGLLSAVFPAKTFGQSSNRWLFVFNTSYAMRDRAKAVQETTLDLLATGMHGRVRAGDTIGAWTFNNKLHTGEIPMQNWSPETAQAVARNVLQFLSQQHYEKSTDFDAAFTNVLKLIRMSDVITVVMISDGNDSIKGTPFDAQLNAFYKTNYRQQKKEQMPFITVFRGVGGNLTTNTVTMAPWPADIPVLPIEAAAEKPKPAPPVVPPLIVVGKKTDYVAPPSATATEVIPSNTPVETTAQLPTRDDSVMPKIEIPPPTLAPDEKSNEAPLTVAAPTDTATQATQPGTDAAPLAQATGTKPDGPTASETSKPNASAAETATAVPSQSLFSARNIAIISVAFTVIVCGLLILSARRSRTPRASLITRSLEEREK